MRPLQPLLLVVATALAPAISARADDIVWTNTAGGAWSTAANWNSGAGPVPGALDRALITTSGTYTVTLDANVTVLGLVLGAGPAAGTQTLTATSRTLTLDGPSSVEPGGVLDLTSSTLDGVGPLANLATVLMRISTIAAPLDNSGTLTARGTSALNGAITQSGTLRVQGITAQGTAALTVASGFTNQGTIEITDANGFPSTLNVTNGTLVNDTGATIHVTAGGGVFRNLNAQLENFGTVLVNQATAIGRTSSDHVNRLGGTITVSGGNLTVTQSGTTPSFLNEGTVTVASGRAWVVSGGTFDHQGSLSGAGGLSISGATATLGVQTLSGLSLTSSTVTLLADGSDSSSVMTITSSTVNGPGRLVNGVGRTMTIISSTIQPALENRGTAVWRGLSALNGALTQTGTLRVQGVGGQGNASLTVADGFTNQGTIEINDIGGFASTLSVTNGTLVNDTGATIHVTAGGGVFRNLNAQLENFGTVLVNQATTIGRTSSDHVNRAGGVITVSGGNLTVSQSGTTPSFLNEGTVTVGSSRTWGVSGGTFDHQGSLSGAGGLSISGATATLGVQTLSLLTISSSTITLLADGSDSSSVMSITGSTVNGPGRLVNGVGRTMTIISSTIQPALENRGTAVWRGSSALNGALTQTGTLRVQGVGGPGTAALTVASGFTNRGTIEINDIGGFASTLSVTSGTLVNDAGATIHVTAGGGVFRNLNAQLENLGTVLVNQATTIGRTSSDHVNRAGGTITVSGGNLTISQTGTTPSFVNEGTVTVASGRAWITSGGALTNAPTGRFQGGGTIQVSGTAFTSSGTIAPGTSAGLLTMTGTWTQQPTAAVEIEIGGTTVGSQFDRLAASGTLTLAGELRVSFINGFTPASGDQFRVLSAGALVGRFDGITGASLPGVTLEPHYDATGLTLIASSQTWTRLMTTGLPPRRDRHSAVYDPSSNRMIVFGGEGDAGVLGDVWILTNANGLGGPPAWGPLAPSGSPPAPRAGHSAVYDAAGNRMIVYGGDDGTGVSPAFGDVHVLSNANGLGGSPAWSEIVPTGTPPPARSRHAAVLDGANDVMIVYGGRSDPASCASALGDVVLLSNTAGAAAWSSPASTGGPPEARWTPGAAFDVAGNRLTIAGGSISCAGVAPGVWVLEGANGLAGTPAWTPLSPSGPPLSVADRPAVYDPSLNRMLAFGGEISGTPGDELWSLTSANGTGGAPSWVPLGTTLNQPPARSRHSAVQDEANRRMIVYGGWSGTGRLGDAWVLDQVSANLVDVPSPGSPTTAAFTGFARPPHPNPFHSRIGFVVTVARVTVASISVLDLQGRVVAALHRGPLEAGEHRFEWDTDRGGHHAGLYFIALEAGGVRETRRVCLLH